MGDSLREGEVPDWVSERVRSGAFASVKEVLEAARRALEAVEHFDPAALRSEVLSIRHEGADALQADLQAALDELDRGDGVPAPLAEIVLWESRLPPEERETLARLRADAARVAAEFETGERRELGEPAQIIARLLREHVTGYVVPRDFAQAVMERVGSDRYGTVEHVLYMALVGMELMEEDPALRRERLRRMLAVGVELLERGEAVDGEEVIQQLRRQTVLRELLARDGTRKET